MLNYFYEKCGVEVNETLVKNIIESPEQSQILNQLARNYVYATLTEKYREEVGVVAVTHRTTSDEYAYLSPSDKYEVDEVINSTYNDYSKQLELIYSDVITLLDDYYDEEEEVTTVFEIREAALRQIASDHTGYMNPNNLHHGITYTTFPQVKEEKLYQRLVGIINRANGINTSQAVDSLAVQHLNAEYVEDLYDILDKDSVSKADEILDWLIDTQIFTDVELYRVTS